MPDRGCGRRVRHGFAVWKCDLVGSYIDPLHGVPQIDGRDPSGVAFAYCYGYIQALIDALGGVGPRGRL